LVRRRKIDQFDQRGRGAERAHRAFAPIQRHVEASRGFVRFAGQTLVQVPICPLAANLIDSGDQQSGRQ
jgi:hypothetical protein